MQSRGYKTYAFHLHLPFFSLRRHKSPLARPLEVRPDGQLRASRELRILASTDGASNSKTKSLWRLDERQVSVLVTGFDEWRFDVVAFANIGRHESYCMEACDGLNVDPILRGSRLAADLISYSPKAYFLEASHVWLNLIEREWQYIVQSLRETVRNHR